jgi:hypothetical protein
MRTETWILEEILELFAFLTMCRARASGLEGRCSIRLSYGRVGLNSSGTPTHRNFDPSSTQSDGGRPMARCGIDRFHVETVSEKTSATRTALLVSHRAILPGRGTPVTPTPDEPEEFL